MRKQSIVGAGSWGGHISLAAVLLLSAASYADQPAYHLQAISPHDADHTSGTTSQPRWSNYIQATNDAGQAIGSARQHKAAYPGYDGRTGWLFDGDTTHIIGLYDAHHTDATSGNTYNTPTYINANGDVTGSASQWGGRGNVTTWLYSDGETVAISPSGGVFTLYPENPYGFYSTPLGISDAGEVLGLARPQKWTSPTTYNSNGERAWVWDGNQTIEVGYFDGEYVLESGYAYNRATGISANGVAAGVARRFDSTASGLSPHSDIAWRWENGVTKRIGYTNNRHTTSNGHQKSRLYLISDTGVIAGSSNSYATNDSYKGQDAWLYDGALIPVGLDEGEHKSSANKRFSVVTHINAAGQAAGTSERYLFSVKRGESVWVYDGNSSVQVGLVDAEHTRDSDSWKESVVSHLNEAGQAAGRSSKYGAGGVALGLSAWYFDGTSTVRVGYTSSLYTRDTDGYQVSSVSDVLENGLVVGHSYRYAPGGIQSGADYWIYDSATTSMLGYTDAEHTNDEGGQSSTLQGSNSSGQVVGTSARYDQDTGAALGAHAWLWNGSELIDMVPGYESLTGKRQSEVFYVGEDGVVLGWFHEYVETSIIPLNEYVPFRYTEAEGFQQLSYNLAPELQALADPIYLRYNRGSSDNGVILASADAQVASFPVALSIEPVIHVEIDFDPTKPFNEIDPAAAGLVSVEVKDALPAGEDPGFDTTQIDSATLSLGRGKAPSVGAYFSGEGMGFAFDIQSSGIACDDTEVVLKGETFAGEQFKGTDSIITNCNESCHP